MILGPLLSTIGVIFEHLEFKTSEGGEHVGKIHLLVSYWNAQGPFGLTFPRCFIDSPEMMNMCTKHVC